MSGMRGKICLTDVIMPVVLYTFRPFTYGAMRAKVAVARGGRMGLPPQSTPIYGANLRTMTIQG